jgi:hypothetical protein
MKLAYKIFTLSMLFFLLDCGQNFVPYYEDSHGWGLIATLIFKLFHPGLILIDVWRKFSELSFP